MILFLRHASTDYNASAGGERVRGQINISLNPEGQQEAQEAAARLHAFVGEGHQIARVIACDLDRAQQTAAPIGKALGLPVTATPALRTWNLGDYQGELVDDAGPEIAKLVASPDTPAPGDGGESYNQFLARFLPFISPFFHDNPDEITLLITHGQNLRAARAWIEAGAKGISVDPELAAAADTGSEHTGLSIAQAPDTFEYLDPKQSKGLS